MKKECFKGPFCSKQGFTLIELLVVVLIIGILAAVAVPQYQKAVLKSRLVEGITQVRVLANAEKAYFLTNGKYTTNIEELDISFPGETITTNNISQVNQDHWHLLLWMANFTPAVVYANLNGARLYIRYYLDTDQLVCDVPTEEDPSICSSVGKKLNITLMPGNESYLIN